MIKQFKLKITLLDNHIYIIFLWCKNEKEALRRGVEMYKQATVEVL